MQSRAPAARTNFCSSHACRPECGLEVIDQLLQSADALRGDEMDALLDLRWVVRHREDAESALAIFCQLRRVMEERHYLAFYRLRRWLANHLEARVTIDRRKGPRFAAVPLDWYCVEAIRHRCLHSVMLPGESMSAPRVEFSFKESAPSDLGGMPCSAASDSE